MTLNEIQTRFSVNKRKFDGKHYLLFTKEPHSGSRMVYKYLCKVARKGHSFFVEGFKPTTKLEVLEQQVKDYVASLPYDSEYYMPFYRKGIFEEHIIHDYLDSIGFKSNHYGMVKDTYKLKDDNIYGFKSSDITITLSGLSNYKSSDDEVPKEVKIILWTGNYSWIETPVKRNVEDIKKGIDSLLKPLYITDSVSNLQRAEKLENVGDIDITLNAIVNNSVHLSGDYKGILKQKLQETLEKLG